MATLDNEYSSVGRVSVLLVKTALGVFFGGIIFGLAIALYRLLFHPLAKYPGPFFAKVTDLHAVYHAWKGDRHLETYRCHEKYGDVYRFGPNKLSFNTNTALHGIYGFKSNCKKGKFYTVFPQKKGIYSTHSEIDQKSHAHKRRVLSHAFSDKALRDMEEYIINHIRVFCDYLASSSEPQNMANRCDYLTFDVLGDLCFGRSFGMQENSDNLFISELIAKSSMRVAICGTMPFLKEWRVDEVLFQDLVAGKLRFNEYCNAQATARTKATSNRKDFFHYLLNAKDPETGAGFSMGQLWAESSLLIVAGADTSSTTLSATFFYLTHNPEVLQKASKEVRDIFGRGNIEAIKSGTSLNSCAYLHACIDEALRLSPPIGGPLHREVLLGGAIIDGHRIRAGTTVSVSAYSIHHNPSYYPAPFEYRPERWLQVESAKMAQTAFCPFSLGSRGCIGKSMAYMELMITMARTLFLFDLRLAGKLGEGASGGDWGRHRIGEYQLQDTFTSRKCGPIVELVKR